MKNKRNKFLICFIAFIALVFGNITFVFARDIEYPSPNEAIVYTSSGLKTALTSTNITKIYLGANIKVTQSDIVVNTKNKQQITIDGGMFTLEEYDRFVTSPSATIRITSKGSLQKLTLQNINIIGNNWYGIFCIYNGISGITQELNNVTYKGPQPVHNRAGFLILDNVDITIRHGVGAKNSDNVAEIKGVTFRNNTNIVKESMGEYNELFWITETPGRGYINIEPGANVIVDNTVYTGGYRSGFAHGSCDYDFNIGEGANFDYKGTRIFWQNLAVENFVVNKNAKVKIDVVGSPDRGVIDWPVLRVKSAFNIEEGSDFQVIVTKSTNTMSAVDLKDASMTVQNPQNILIYNNSGDAISQDSLSHMNYYMNRLAFYNYASKDLNNLGTPLYLWKNNSGVIRIITATLATGKMKTFSSGNYDNSGSPLNQSTFNTKGIKVVSFNGSNIVNL